MCCRQCLSKLTELYEFVQECQRATETLISFGSFRVLLIDANEPLSKENVISIPNDHEKQTDSFQDGSDESEIYSPSDFNKKWTSPEDCMAVKRILCSYCKESFEDHTLLKAHICIAHPGNRPHTCPICNKGFQSVSNRNTHIQSHNPVESYKCPKCKKSFRSKVYLNKHTKFVHSVAQKECKICNKTFINSAKFKYHSRLHDASKQFHCKYCNRSFIQIHHLQNHERTHTGVCPFLCPVCGHRFKAACNLKLHMRVHNNDRKSLKEYQCECGKSFNQKSSLTVHLRSHREHKRYKCNQCEEKFAEKQQLTNHFKALHTENTLVHEFIKTEDKQKDKEKQKNCLPYVCTICEKRFKVTRFY